MFALLKKMGWATSLSAGEGGGSLSSRSIFMIHIELTDIGQYLLPHLTRTCTWNNRNTKTTVMQSSHSCKVK